MVLFIVVKKHYKKFNQTDQGELRNALLQMVFMDQVGAVRTAIAGVISVLAESVFTLNGQWNELFTLLAQLAGDAEPSRQTLTYNLIGQLSEHIPEHLLPHTATLCQMVMI